MLTATAVGAGIRLSAAATVAAASGASWWDVASGVLLAAAGAWATWAQFVYPKIADRKAKAAAANNTTPPPAPGPPPTDLVGEFYRDQSQRLDDVLDQLDQAHRKHARDAGAIARLTAERDEARRQTCTHQHPGVTP